MKYRKETYRQLCVENTDKMKQLFSPFKRTNMAISIKIPTAVAKCYPSKNALYKGQFHQMYA